MKIIVESGATKSAWRICDGKTVVNQYDVDGMNLSSMTPDRIKSALGDGLRKSGLREAGALYLYAAGLASEEMKGDLCSFIRSFVDVDYIDIQDDMVAAARALCGHEAGIVAILGTGSNSCWYDGREIHHKVYSGGYILGDFGSASVLGRMFLTDYIKNRVPSSLSEEFRKSFESSYEEIVGNVYGGPAPAAYLGSLAPFIVSNYYSSEYAKTIVDSNFISFIETSLKVYDFNKYPVGVAGSFGFACKEIFTALCDKEGIRISKYMKEPIAGLLEF